MGSEVGNETVETVRKKLKVRRAVLCRTMGRSGRKNTLDAVRSSGPISTGEICGKTGGGVRGASTPQHEKKQTPQERGHLMLGISHRSSLRGNHGHTGKVWDDHTGVIGS